MQKIIEHSPSHMILTCRDESGALVMRQYLSYMPPPYLMENPKDRERLGYSNAIGDYSRQERESFGRRVLAGL